MPAYWTVANKKAGAGLLQQGYVAVAAL